MVYYKVSSSCEEQNKLKEMRECFHGYLLNTVVSETNGHCIFRARILLKQLISLIGHCVHCNARIAADKHRRSTITIAQHAH